MKKILSIALCAAAVSAFADPTETVLGQVGVTKITTKLPTAIVAVSYGDLALTNGSGIVVSNVVKTTNLTVGDRLAIFKNGEYTTWTLALGEEDVKYWAKNDRAFFVDANGNQTEGPVTSASGITAAVGTGIWLVRQKPTDDKGAIPFYIYGKPVDSEVSTAIAGKWTLLGNPKQAAAKPTITDMADGDTIQMPTERGMLNVYTYKEALKKWTYWNEKVPEVTEAPEVPAGLGFWYVSTGEDSVKVEW